MEAIDKYEESIFVADEGALGGVDRPSKSWTDAFVKAAALNTGASRGEAPMKAQQRYHAAYMKKLAEGESKWPGIDFTTGL